MWYVFRMKLAPVLCALLSTLCWAAPTEADLTFEWEIDPFSRPSRGADMGGHLDDVQTVFVVLSRMDVEHAAHIKAATEELRPICTRLRALPPDELRQLCLLADAIEWQTDWVRDTYKSTHGDIAIQPRPCGLEIVVELSKRILNKLNRSSTSQEHVDALLELLSLFGGMDYLAMPRCLLDHRIAIDYKTAYNFFVEFTAACSLVDDAACINRLNALTPVLDYLLQGGEADRHRVGALALAYSSEIPQLKLIVEAEAVNSSTSSPSTKRQVALQPFFEKLPELEAFFCICIRCRCVENW